MNDGEEFSHIVNVALQLDLTGDKAADRSLLAILQQFVNVNVSECPGLVAVISMRSSMLLLASDACIVKCGCK